MMSENQPMLSKTDIDDFHEFGYLRIHGVLTRDEAETYRQHILGMVPRDLSMPFPWRSSSGRIKPYHDGYGEQETRYGHEDDGIWDTPELLPMLCHPELYKAAAELMGEAKLRVQDGTIGITLRNDEATFGLGATRVDEGEQSLLSQPLHIDSSVPETVNNFTFTDTELQVGGCFYLTDVEPRGGGIHVVPRGHKLVEEQSRASANGRALQSYWHDIKDFPETVEVTGEAGDFIMTHYLMPHAASHNRRARTRVAYFIRYSRLDHPFFPPPAPDPRRFNLRQVRAMGDTGRKLLGVEAW